MNRNERNSLHTIFKAVHASKGSRTPSSQWRRNVMADIASMDTLEKEDLLSLFAPRFTLAATAVSAIALMAGIWAMPGLIDEIQAAYSSQLLDSTSTFWTLL